MFRTVYKLVLTKRQCVLDKTYYAILTIGGHVFGACGLGRAAAVFAAGGSSHTRLGELPDQYDSWKVYEPFSLRCGLDHCLCTPPELI